MRRAFSEWITNKASEDEKIYLLVNDIGYGYFDEFKKKFPDRFLNLGITEQATMSIAAGMALSGLKPYVYSITPFVTERCLEQIKVDVDCNEANVVIVGYDDYPNQGPTHASCGEGEFMCMFPNINSYWPINGMEVFECLDYIYECNRAGFLRLRRDKDR